MRLAGEPAERQPASGAAKGRDSLETLPAFAAEGVAAGGPESLGADRTEGREDEIEGSGEPLPPP
jgi:hypothetical protein